VGGVGGEGTRGRGCGGGELGESISEIPGTDTPACTRVIIIASQQTNKANNATTTTISAIRANRSTKPEIQARYTRTHQQVRNGGTPNGSH